MYKVQDYDFLHNNAARPLNLKVKSTYMTVPFH